MNKIVIAVVVLLAAAAGAAPMLVGQQAEGAVRSLTQEIDNDTLFWKVEIQSYERGYLGSDLVHRFQPVGADTDGEVPVFVLKTHLDHGPFAGGLNAAKGRSTLSLEGGGPASIQVPGEILTTVGFDQSLVSHFKLDDYSWPVPDADGKATWRNVDVTLETDGALSEVHVHGSLGTVALEAEDGSMTYGPMDIVADQARSEFGFWTGSGKVTVNAIDVLAPMQGVAFSVKGFEIESRSAVDDGLVSSISIMKVPTIELPGFEPIALDISITFDRLDAAATGRLVKMIQEAANDDPAAMSNGALMTEAFAMIRPGPRFSVDPFTIALGDEKAEMDIKLALPPEAERMSPGPETLPLDLMADANLRLPSGMVQIMAQVQPQVAMGVQQLLAMGMLNQQGDDYVLAAQYRAGSLTVNGAPVPLPFLP